MKKLAFFVLLLMFSFSGVYAQKYAYVDTEYILGKIPTYESAQKELDELAAEYQKEIEAAYKQVDAMYKKFQAEKVLMTEEMKTEKEEEIVRKEKDAKELQKKYFGKDGELFSRRQELVKPIQDEIFKAVEDLAQKGNYAVIFDTASGATILYSNSKYDKSDEILESLGYKQ